MKKIFLLFIFVNSFLFAGTTGKITGKVTDTQSGEPLIGANILIVGTNLGAATDAEGKFLILNIPPGNYSVRISYLGYETVLVEGVKIVVDQTTELFEKLSTKTIQVNEVVVTAQTPLIQRDLTSSKSVITRDEINALPVSTFTELLSLQAGVVGSGSNLHIRGGRSNEVAYLIDGMYVQDPLLGGLATQINNDAIQEMSLLSGTFNAEYGDALSGVVNIVTRDGGEKLSGKIEYRTSEFGVKRYADLDESRLNGSLSGTLVDNLTFFLSAEQNNNGSYLPFGYNKDKTFFSKLTTTVIPSLKISFSNRGSVGKKQNYNHAWKYISDQYSKIKTDSWQSALTFTHTVSNNFFYDLRLSYFNQGYFSGIDKDTSQFLPTTQRQYFPQYGNGFEFYSLADPVELIDSRTATADIKADAVWQADEVNEVKFGAAYKKHWLRYYYVYDPKRDFPYLNDYRTNPFEAAAYVQDKIELPYLII